jgi:hypothetical protein
MIGTLPHQPGSPYPGVRTVETSPSANRFQFCFTVPVPGLCPYSQNVSNQEFRTPAEFATHSAKTTVKRPPCPSQLGSYSSTSPCSFSKGSGLKQPTVWMVKVILTRTQGNDTLVKMVQLKHVATRLIIEEDWWRIGKWRNWMRNGGPSLGVSVLLPVVSPASPSGPVQSLFLSFMGKECLLQLLFQVWVALFSSPKQNYVRFKFFSDKCRLVVFKCSATEGLLIQQLQMGCRPLSWLFERRGMQPTQWPAEPEQSVKVHLNYVHLPVGGKAFEKFRPRLRCWI